MWIIFIVIKQRVRVSYILAVGSSQFCSKRVLNTLDV